MGPNNPLVHLGYQFSHFANKPAYRNTRFYYRRSEQVIA